MNGTSPLPPICLAHAAYGLGDAFARRFPGTPYRFVTSLDELAGSLDDAEVLVVSGLWRDELVARAPKLRFIQSVSAGTNMFSREVLAARNIRLASASGVNERAVAEHAMSLILAFTRHLPQARDNQHARVWQGMIGQVSARQDELTGKTLAIVGLGRIGTRLARLARAFDMRVVGVKRDTSVPNEHVDALLTTERLLGALAEADFVVLTCPLTPDTERLIRAEHFAAMKPTAYLVNVARGRVVDEPALLAALDAGEIAGAGLDCVVEEPLPATSPLWGYRNVILTPHAGGETQRYETDLIELLADNLERLAAGRELRNAVV